jgi:hypothetical protein
MLSRFATLGSGVVTPTDPYWAYVKYMIVGNGANNSTINIVDSSNVHATTVVHGNVVISTAQSKFGSGSLYFNGDGTSYITTPTTSSFNARTTPYTVDFWVYPISSVSMVGWLNTTGNGYYIENYSGGLYVGDGSVNTIGGQTGLSVGQWTFVSVSFDGATTRLFFNGVLVQSGTTLLSNTTLSDWYIGIKSNLTRNFNGYMYDLRITVGYCRYTATFTPPTGPLPTLGP